MTSFIALNTRVPTSIPQSLTFSGQALRLLEASWCRENSVAGPKVQEQRKHRQCLPLPKAEDCRVRVVAEATERAPEERKSRWCVAFQDEPLKG